MVPKAFDHGGRGPVRRASRERPRPLM
jgi:hypothetical protein